MLSYAIRRILQFIPTIIGISLIMFVLLNVLPGNAALMSADKGRSADSNYIEAMKKQWGLDQPLHVRYFKYMKNLARGDLGESFLRGEDVATLIGSRIWPTLKLALIAIAIAVVFGIPLGFISALKHNTWIDTFSMVGAVSGVSVPHFWLGLILMYLLSIKLHLLPTFGYGGWKLFIYDHAVNHFGCRLYGPFGKNDKSSSAGSTQSGLYSHSKIQGAFPSLDQSKTYFEKYVGSHHDDSWTSVWFFTWKYGYR